MCDEFAETAYATTQDVILLLMQLRLGNVPDVVVFYNLTGDIGAGTDPVELTFMPTSMILPPGSRALIDFFGARLWWWLAPAVSILMVLVGLAIYQQRAVITVTPFIYTLF